MNSTDRLDLMMRRVEDFIELNFGHHVLEALFSVGAADTREMPDDLLCVLHRWSFCESFTLISSKHSRANVQSTIELGDCTYQILGVVHYREHGTYANHLLLWYAGKEAWDLDTSWEDNADNADNAEDNAVDNAARYTPDKRLYRYAPGDSCFICVYEDFLDLVTYFMEELEAKNYFWNPQQQLLQKNY